MKQLLLLSLILLSLLEGLSGQLLPSDCGDLSANIGDSYYSSVLQAQSDLEDYIGVEKGVIGDCGLGSIEGDGVVLSLPDYYKGNSTISLSHVTWYFEGEAPIIGGLSQDVSRFSSGAHSVGVCYTYNYYYAGDGVYTFSSGIEFDFEKQPRISCSNANFGLALQDKINYWGLELTGSLDSYFGSSVPTLFEDAYVDFLLPGNLVSNVFDYDGFWVKYSDGTEEYYDRDELRIRHEFDLSCGELSTKEWLNICFVQNIKDCNKDAYLSYRYEFSVLGKSCSNQDFVISSDSECGLYNFSYSSTGNASIVEPVWQLGNEVFTGSSFSKEFNQGGYYQISLRDGSDADFLPVVYNFEVALPVASFSKAYDCSSSSTIVRIDNYDPTQYSYYWMLDNVYTTDPPSSGLLAGEISVSGGQSLLLHVRSLSSGCSAYLSEEISTSISGDFTIEADGYCEGETLRPLTAPNGSNYLWTLTYPDGRAETYPTRFFYKSLSELGDYSLGLSYETTDGCPKTIGAKSFTVSGQPSLEFSSTYGLCGDYEVVYHIENATVGVDYEINYGDGSQGSGTLTGSSLDLAKTYTSSGSYRADISLVNGGCEVSKSSQVQLSSSPSLEITGINSFCYGGSSLLEARVTGGVDLSGSTYEWEYSSTGNIGSYTSLSEVGGPDYSANQTGFYRVLLNLGSGCDDLSSEAVEVIEVVDIVGEVTGSEAASCYDVQDGSISIQVSEELALQGYRLSTGVGELNDINYSVEGLGIGVNYIRLESSINSACNITLSEEVANGGPNIELESIEPSMCGGQSGSIDLEVVGSGLVYNWRQLSSVLENPNFNGPGSSDLTGIESGEYLLEVVDENGCQASEEFLVPEKVLLLNVLDNNLSACLGQEVSFEVESYYTDEVLSSSFSYLYDDLSVSGENYESLASSIVSSNVSRLSLSSGDYMLRVLDETTGCQTDVSLSIEELASLSVRFELDPPLCPDDEGELRGIVSGGTGGYTYQWNELSSPEELLGESSNLTGVLNGLTYELTVSDEGGCSLEDNNSYTVSSLSSTPITTSVIDGGDNCELVLDISGGVSPYSVEWQFEGEVDQYYQGSDPNSEVEEDNLAVNSSRVMSWYVYHSYGGESPLGTKTINFEESGNYKYKVIDSYGCETDFVERYLSYSSDNENFPKFAFVFSGKEVVQEEDNDEPFDQEVRERMQEASEQLSDILSSCDEIQQSNRETFYEGTCLNPDTFDDEFVVSYTDDIYHYTLYYYDRSGRLTKTVPPEGVELLSNDQIISLSSEMLTNTVDESAYPDHRMETTYEYNTLGQMISQNTPDGKESFFIYDGENRLRFSQNAQQKKEARASYMQYDRLGRVKEAGEFDLGGSFEGLRSVIYTNDNNYPSSGKTEFTRTVYSEQAEGISYYQKPQRFLRNRVSYSYRDSDGDPSTKTDQQSTYYSYDPHGNVEWMIQEDPVLGKSYISYDYDLISGNVLEVKYNELGVDAFYHRYSYDRDNRLVGVKTSRDGILWEEDASYDYYAHGPLRRTELGEDHVQGEDYAYTVEGWLKLKNSPNLDGDLSMDLGSDGSSQSGITSVAKDAYGMALGYYRGDYKISNGTSYGIDDFEQVMTSSGKPDLYNGNIRFWANSMRNIGEEGYLPAKMNVYSYDVLNRLKESKEYSISGSIPEYQYYSSYSYDANGNLKALKRYDGSGELMDELDYDYSDPDPDLEAGSEANPVSTNEKKLHNKLRSVNDLADISSEELGDIKGKTSYVYDEIGNLTKEEGIVIMDYGEGEQEYKEVRDITWNVSGKVASVEVTVLDESNSSIKDKKLIEFYYDGLGNRVRKEVTENGASSYDPSDKTSYYYVRDAQGNLMAMYHQENVLVGSSNGSSTYEASFKLIERPIYGSDRLGLDRPNIDLGKVIFTAGHPINLSENSSGREGIEYKSSYTNWVLSSSHQNTESDLFKTRLSNLVQTDLGLDRDQSSLGKSFVGHVSQAVAVGENFDGELQFYAVHAENYLGSSENYLLVFDKHGDLMKGTDKIGAINSSCQPIIVNYPGTTNYGIIALGLDGNLYSHEVDMGSYGYGDIDALGEVVSSSNLIGSRSGVYGGHMTAFEDHVNGRVIVYATSMVEGYTEIENKSSLIAYEYSGGNWTEHLVYSLPADCGSNRDGELQLSSKGEYVGWYYHGRQIAEFDYREVKLYQIPLSNDKLSVDGDVKSIESNGSGNLSGGGSLAFGLKEGKLYFTQNGIDEPCSRVEEYDLLQEALVDPDLGMLDYLVHDIRKSKDGNLYVSSLKLSEDQISSYVSIASNSEQTISTGIDLSGSDEDYFWNGDLPTQVLKVGSLKNNRLGSRYLGDKNYELKDHLGNVRVTISDKKLDGGDLYLAEVLTSSDYYPFGMQMPGRNFSSDSYRYGYQGSEKDDEVKGTGNSYTTFFRQLDPRIGRWFSIDPVFQPWQSPYNSMDNNPIMHNDPLGDWVWGAGLKNNLTKTDRQNEAEMFRDKTGGSITHNTKDDTYTVNYVTGSTDYVDSEGRTNVMVNTASQTFDSKGAFESFSDGLRGLAGGLRESVMSSTQGARDYRDKVSNALTEANRIVDAAMKPYKDEFLVKAKALYTIQAQLGGSGMAQGVPVSFNASVTTKDGFLLKGFHIKAPFDIPAQRFGNMNYARPDFWGPRIGTSTTANRVFGAIKPSWNPLTQYTKGVIPKGTPIKVGIIGPQGWRYPGGSLQFITNSKDVVGQTTKIITR